LLLLVEIAAAVASLAVVVIAVATVRTMFCIEKATNQISQLTKEIQQGVGQVNEFTREVRETLASARGVIAPIRRVVDRFETLGQRTADLSATVLEEVEPPLRTAVTVARGMRSVTAYLLERLSHRFTRGRSATNGGYDSE
jgi:uncharacterized protein YoxC